MTRSPDETPAGPPRGDDPPDTHAPSEPDPRDSMPPITRAEATRILERVTRDGDECLGALLPSIYHELRDLAGHLFARQSPGHTLQPTALVHEAYLKLVDHEDENWNGRAHFKAVAARAMRQVLIDHYRARQADKRGGGRARRSLSGGELELPGQEIDPLELHEVLERLAEIDAREARVVELKFFGGLTTAEIAAVLDVSTRTVETDWRHARAWLHAKLA